MVRGYRVGLLASLRQADGIEGDAGTHDIEIGVGSPLVGRQLRNAQLPDGVIVTAIQRNRDLIVPAGDTVLRTRDRLVMIGRSDDIDSIEATVRSSPTDPSSTSAPR
ncbi:MAG: TrkA C-terminal domain-containing protein [Acidimicrobiales bacterium]